MKAVDGAWTCAVTPFGREVTAPALSSPPSCFAALSLARALGVIILVVFQIVGFCLAALAGFSQLVKAPTLPSTFLSPGPVNSYVLPFPFSILPSMRSLQSGNGCSIGNSALVVSKLVLDREAVESGKSSSRCSQFRLLRSQPRDELIGMHWDTGQEKIFDFTSLQNTKANNLLPTLSVALGVVVWSKCAWVVLGSIADNDGIHKWSRCRQSDMDSECSWQICAATGTMMP